MIVKEGSKITVEYEGKFESGEIFDSSSRNGEIKPLIFVVGSGKVIKGFDDGVKGMKNNEEKEIIINPEEAYGMPNPEFKKEFNKDFFPKDQEPKEGMVIIMKSAEGQEIPARIDSVKDDLVTVDLNHPLAGKKLIFKVKIVGIEE